jgi:branched-chain amino acid transport system ATP-binding protein
MRQPASTDTASGERRATPALEVKNVNSGYGHTTILRDVTLTVDTSSVVALLGPNGAGKSTLVKTVSGLLRPTQGTVQVNGRDVTKLAPNRRVALGVCHIPEGRGIFRSLTVRDNLVMQSEPGTEADSIERAAAAFPILGERLRQQAGTLSGGQQQMLAMARAYVRAPQLVLVDEASLGLAPLVVDAIFEALHELTRQGAALLIVDQFITRALNMASKAYVLNRGEITYAGSPDELLSGGVFEQYIGADQ